MRRILREESKGFNNRTLEIQCIQKRKKKDTKLKVFVLVKLMWERGTKQAYQKFNIMQVYIVKI